MDNDKKRNYSQKRKEDFDYSVHNKRSGNNIRLPDYFRDDSTDEILEALKILKEGILNKKINWKLFNHVYRNLKLEQYTLPKCLSLLMEILKVLERYNCKDIFVLLDIVEVVFHATHTNNLEDVNKLIDIMRSPALKFLIRGLHQKKYFLYEEIEEDSECDDYVWLAASYGNLDLLKMLLKTGIGMTGPKEYFAEIFDFSVILENLPTHPTVNLDESMDAVDKILQGCVPMPRRRIVLVTRALTILTSMVISGEYLEEYATCYKLLFHSIAEPYVSCVELTKFLTDVLPDEFNHTVVDVVGKFKMLLPEVPEKSEPRTLQHLCRVEIRQSLRQNLNLLHGVSALELPKKLQKYILLNEDFDYKIRMTGIFLDDFYLPLPAPISYVENQEEDDIITYIRNL